MPVAKNLLVVALDVIRRRFQLLLVNHVFHLGIEDLIGGFDVLIPELLGVLIHVGLQLGRVRHVIVLVARLVPVHEHEADDHAGDGNDQEQIEQDAQENARAGGNVAEEIPQAPDQHRDEGYRDRNHAVQLVLAQELSFVPFFGFLMEYVLLFHMLFW